MAEGTWRSQGPTGPPGVTRQASDRRVEPPLVVQNAMLTKDKKPFTYTPGGIDLSEIRSPRMARRIEINANAPGVGDVHRISPPRGPTGPLPPSALAAMQPALPVQVFPSPPPAPPPPPVNIPPPPPPMEPLPTKTIATNEGFFERPDMTKIIPENPMALLRKTGGVNRRSYVEEPAYTEVRPHVNNQDNYVSPQISMPQARPSVAQYQVSPPTQQAPQAQAQSQFVQPKPQMAAGPKQEAYQEQPPEMKTSTAQLGSLYIPPLNNENQRTGNTPPVAKVVSPPTPPQRSPQSPSQSPGSPQSPMATLHRAPRPWQNQKPPAAEVPVWAQRSHSPPEDEEAQQQSPLTTPVNQPVGQVNYQQRAPQSPAVQQNVVSQQIPQRTPQSPGWAQNQQRVQQQPNVQPNIVGRVIIPVQMDAPPANQNVDAVYVTQPIVLQHPGARPEANQQKIKQQQQQQQQKQQQQQQYQQQQKQQQLQQQQQQKMQTQNQKPEPKAVRIIPIQIEASPVSNNVQRQDSNHSSNASSATPGTARTFVRQPSWSQSGPTQSNSFKILQKITNTDGDDDENEESTEHGPRTFQQFEQPPADQIRKIKLNEDDQQFMNKLKQGIDEENFLHNEVDPRYRGATIPSKAFKFLQSMTDSSNQPVSSVPRSNQAGNQGPNVRTIPVQMEGEATGKPYIPPSEQTVQEPKKYTGGKIPSRSFKVLQAMTGETCADVNQGSDSIENCPPPTDPSYYYGFNANYPHLPPPPAPYWPNYWPPYFYSPCPTPTNELCKKDTAEKPPASARNTPLPFQKPPRKIKDSSESDSEYEKKVTTNPRSTPLPFRGCSPQKPLRKPSKDSESDSETDKRVNLNIRSQTPLSFRGCSPQISRRVANKDSSSDSEHEKKINATARSTPLPFRGCSPQTSSKRQSRDHEFDHMEGARRSTSAPRSTTGSLPPYWGCYSPFYPLPYQDCDWEVEQIRNSSDDSKTNSRNTPLPFWGCYSPFYPIPYQNESDIEAEQTRSSQSQDTDSEDANYTPYPYWDPYSYPPYYYGYPSMYPYPIYPSVPCDSEESVNYSSTDEMALYNQVYEQNPLQVDDVNNEEPDDSTPTPEKCQNFEEIRNKFEEKCKKGKEMNNVKAAEKGKSVQEDMIQIPDEKCNNFQELRKAFEDNCYVEDNRNFLNQHVNEKTRKLEESCNVITTENLVKHNEKYSDVDTETETETETETHANSSDSDYSDTETEVEDESNPSPNKYSNSYGSLQAIKSVSDINIYSVDIPSSCTDEEDNVSEGTTTTEENDDASEYIGDEAIPHQLSTIYEESERSDCSRIGRHTRESSVATTVSVETVTAGNDRESDRESDETCINGTVYLDENDEINADIHIRNNTNEKIDVDTTFTMDQRTEVKPYRSKSRLEDNIEVSAALSPAKSNSEVHDGGGSSKRADIDGSSSPTACEADRNTVSVGEKDKNKNSEFVKQSDNNENFSIQEISNNDNAENNENQDQQDDDGPDFWSEINKGRDDDIVSYRRSIFKYRNDEYDTSYDNSTIDENTEQNNVEDLNNQSRLKENVISENDKLIIKEIQTDTDTEELDQSEAEQLVNNSVLQNSIESSAEELKVADETSIKETQKFAVIHDEDATNFISESHTDITHATVTEGENSKTTITTNSKVDSSNNELVLDQNVLTKEKLVNGVIKSSRMETAVCKDVTEVNKDKVINNFVTENKEQVNQIYTMETENGEIVNEKMTEDNFRRSGKSITSINGDNEDTSSEIVHQNSQEIIFNEEGSKKHSSKELQSQQMLRSGIVESTNSLIENLESFNKLSKQYYLGTNQYKTEEIKQNISSNKVIEDTVQDNMIARQEKEELVKKETNKSTIETANGYKEIRHKKITKKSKQYSIISSEYESDIESPKIIKNKRMELKQTAETNKNNNKEASPNPEQQCPERNEIKLKKIKPEIKKANQEVISDDFEVCDECSPSSDIQNIVCSQDLQQQYQPQDQITENEAEVKLPSIKERIEALQRASQAKTKEKNDIDVPLNIKERISVVEDNQPQGESLKAQSTKSRRSLEDISEDDIDSGVTSDISRHLSDNESDFPELRKMTRYQRASTHSRLFKLLQEECENEDNEEEDKIEPTVIVNNVIEDVGSKETMQSRRESLTLPLKNYSESDSFSSSGINSPGSPVVSERLVSELVQSLLRRKKGQIFRGMSMDKLHAAAFRILQEELEGAQMSPPSNFLSPLRNSTGDSTPAQTPQEFYGNYPEYNQYYDSWNEAHLSYENNYDILPSRAFKMIHDHAIANKSGGISGYLARCPRVLSGRNKDLIYLSENRPVSQSPEHSLETNGATSAS